MNPELKMLFFRGGRKREQLLLNENVIELPVGRITCLIMQLDDTFFDDLKNVPKQVEKLAERYRAEKQEIFQQQKAAIGKKNLLLLKKCLDGLILSTANDSVQLLFRLLVYLPCFEAYSQAYDASERLLVGKSHLKYLMGQLSKPNSDDSQLTENAEAFNSGSKLHTLSAVWGNFIAFLTGETEDGFWELVANVVFAEDGYANRLKNCLTEVWRLKTDLQYAWEKSDKQYTLTELRQHLAGPRILDRGSQSSFFNSDSEFVLKGEIYGIVSFTELVMAELKLFALIDREPRRCELCGQYFIPYRKETIYCSMPNPAYNNRSCAKEGARLRYQKAHPFLKTPLGQAHIRNYKAYKMWMKRNIAFLQNKYDEVYAAEEKDVQEKLKYQIILDLSARWDEWDKKTRGAIFDYENHTISDEELLAAIELPPPRERSPLMEAFRTEEKIREGRG